MAGCNYTLQRQADYWLGEFTVMASPCQILLEDMSETVAKALVQQAYQEAKRIELKYSRYCSDNVIAQLNSQAGKAMTLDDETARLIDFAQLCFQLSDGLFDISSGILGKLWHFKQQTQIPTDADIQTLLPAIGWHKVSWQPPRLTLPAGMQVDLGGIGKEYAVDKVVAILQSKTDSAFLVNFGGDIYANKLRRNGQAWQVTIEDPQQLGSGHTIISLTQGGIASSGDSQRFIDIAGQRYGHILNPKTGYPITGGPSQITVYAQNCVQAGMLATIALLQGEHAQAFLDAQHCRYWLNG